jgi:transcription termination factor Rho
MTESADQPLLAEERGDGEKKQSTAKPRVAKARTPKTAKTKSGKTKTPRKKKVDAESAAEPAVESGTKGEATQPPPSPMTPPAVITPGGNHTVEEWSPSDGKRPAGPPEPASTNENPPAATTGSRDAKPPSSSAQREAAPSRSAEPAPTSQPARQYPVYIPRHVAKQMEQEGKQAPLAVSAQEAAELQIPRVADPLPRLEQPPRVELQPEVEAPAWNEQAPARDEEIGHGEGIVEISGKGFGFIRDAKRSFAQNPNDIFVTPETVRRYNLRDGQWIAGETRRGNRGSQLHRLVTVNGEDPEVARNFPAFDELTVISPLERITLETVPDRYTTRVIDLMAPIGKGQRGLIVAPPRTGKTTLLQHMADAVVKNHPELKLIILLVDERPEEVTDFKRTVPAAEIMASSNDMDVKSHTRIAQLAIERAKRLVEAGKDVFILLDSITRVGRAFNNAATGGRTMSGGLDSRALEIPRKIFAAARNTEEAGSLTIMGTALIETNSRMDEVIFQEFKERETWNWSSTGRSVINGSTQRSISFFPGRGAKNCSSRGRFAQNPRNPARPCRVQATRSDGADAFLCEKVSHQRADASRKSLVKRPIGLVRAMEMEGR